MKIITIGRSSGNNVVISDSMVSKSHCQIIQDNNGNYRLIDNNSTNGTYINGEKRHGEIRLNQSDIIRIGNTTLPWQAYFQGGTEVVRGGAVYDGDSYYTPSTSHIKPDNYLVWSILVTVFFGWFLTSLVFGILAIVNSTKVDKLWNDKNYSGAKNAAQNAKKWCWWAFGVGIGTILLSGLLYWYFVLRVVSYYTAPFLF